ncbi:MAG: hypothetical protein ACLKAK_07265 [Alkaliphilus sp.]
MSKLINNMIVINNTRISNKAWEDVDKTLLQSNLLEMLKEERPMAEAAVRECHAIIKSETLEDAPSQNWLMPHHVISGNNLILNRGGMIKAAKTLVDARDELNLTLEQRREAANHLLRHFKQKEVNLHPPENLTTIATGEASNVSGDMSGIVGRITAEMRVNDIPLNGKINVQKLKESDNDPCEIIVEIPVSKSTRGWKYEESALKDIIKTVMEQGLSGFLGHQKQDDVEYEFPTPVTHWVGGLFQDGKAYIRGVVDKSATDLKRWIRAGSIQQVSIYGYADTEGTGEETQVKGFEALSIDWVPLGRAGMPTRIVAIGETSGAKLNEGVKKMTLLELLAELRKLGAKPSQVVGEMGWNVKLLAKEMDWKLDEVAGEVDGKRWEQLTEMVKVIGEMTEVFGLKKEDKLSSLVEAVKEARKAQTNALTAEHDKLADKVISEMVQAEAVRPLVKRMLKVDGAVDEKGIKKAVGEMLEAKDIKDALTNIFKGSPISPKDDGRNKPGSSVVVKKVAI